MPHFGLMEEKRLGPIAGPLQRSKLHVRAGRRRLRQGKLSAGIVTLYDAFIAAMEWYAASPEGRKTLIVLPGENTRDEKTLYKVLTRSGVIDGRFDFKAFDLLTEKALTGELPQYDYGPLVSQIESVLTQLGVLPLDEASLPPEDPATF